MAFAQKLGYIAIPKTHPTSSESPENTCIETTKKTTKIGAICFTVCVHLFRSKNRPDHEWWSVMRFTKGAQAKKLLLNKLVFETLPHPQYFAWEIVMHARFLQNVKKEQDKKMPVCILYVLVL